MYYNSKVLLTNDDGYESEGIRHPQLVELPEQPKAKFCSIM